MNWAMVSIIDDQPIRVGSDRYMALEEIGIPESIRELQETCQEIGHSVVMVAVGDTLVGAIELQPTIRPEAKTVIQELKRRRMELIIISGDQEKPTHKLAQDLGIDHYFANTLPENKADLVRHLQQKGRTVCFVGDGINDAIALKTAHVSISLQGATTAAIDTAQIVLLTQSLHQLPFLFDVGHQFKANMRAGFITAIVPGVVIIGGAYLGLVGIAGSIVIWIGSLLVGLGIAKQPLLTENHQANQLTANQKQLTS